MGRPREILHEITSFLSPLSRMASQRALPTKQRVTAQIWAYIFKDEAWIDKILNIDTYRMPEPLPSILGRDLLMVANGKTKGRYLTLLVDDWTGESKYLKELFFKSLQPHVYDEEKEEVLLTDSGITLHIWDAIGGGFGERVIRIKDPRRLFRLQGNQLSTYILYHTDDKISTIGDSSIARMQGIPLKKKMPVAEICCLHLKSSSGSNVERVFVSTSKTTKVVSVLSPGADKKTVGYRRAANMEEENF